MSNQDPYSKFNGDNLTLRDELAIDRTLLANERTFLAYLRSGAALLIAGITFAQLGTTEIIVNAGIACLPVGAILTLFGTVRFVRTLWRVRKVRRKNKTPK